MAEFKEALSSGKQYEYMYRDHLRQWYPNTAVVEGYCKGFDIFIPERNETIEVKLDKKSNYTGNIVIEIEFNGKASGLITSTADHWVFCDGEEWIRYLTSRLRDLVTPFKPATFVGNGDIKPKKAYLIEKRIIKENADKISRVY